METKFIVKRIKISSMKCVVRSSGKFLKRGFKLLLLNLVILGVPSFTLAQAQNINDHAGVNSVIDKYGVDGYLVVFWNVENFFDLMPSPQHQESGFTPKGHMRWSRKRFNKKRDGLSKVIMATGTNEELPVIIGLAEIENRYVLNQLIYETPLFYGNYRIVHKDSPDRRGIDVALLYRKDLFKTLHTQWIPVEVADSQYSRDILYVKGVFHDLDTIHFFVNHWPSKFGGEKESGPKRLAAAVALASICDSLLLSNPKVNILAMGDFNDTQDSKAFAPLNKLILLEHNLCFTSKSLVSKQEKGSNSNKYEDNRGRSDNRDSEFNNMGIVNLKGSIKYRGVWEKIDHFFVSENVLDSNEPISVDELSVLTFGAKYLLEKDKAYIGTKPFRTYIGPRYNGGLSDHVPIVLKIKRNW